MPARQCSSVVLPEPDGPMIAVGPASTSRSTPARAGVTAVPVPQDLVSDRAVRSMRPAFRAAARRASPDDRPVRSDSGPPGGPSLRPWWQPTTVRVRCPRADEPADKPDSVVPEDRRSSICDRCCQRPGATYPVTRASSPRTSPQVPCRLSSAAHPLGLASGGVCRATPVTRGAGGLLHRRFTLTSAGAEAVCFLWHCPAGHPGWALPTTVLCEVRTFLDPGTQAEVTRPERPGRDRLADSSADQRRGSRPGNRTVSRSGRCRGGGRTPAAGERPGLRAARRLPSPAPPRPPGGPAP